MLTLYMINLPLIDLLVTTFPLLESEWDRELYLQVLCDLKYIDRPEDGTNNFKCSNCRIEISNLNYRLNNWFCSKCSHFMERLYHKAKLK